MKRPVEIIDLTMPEEPSKKPRYEVEDKFFNVVMLGGKPNIIKLIELLEDGTNPNCVDKDGRTPLWRAIHHFFFNVLTYTYGSGSEGRPDPHESDYILAITLLLMYGADDSIIVCDLSRNVGTCRNMITTHWILRPFMIYDKVELLKDIFKHLLCASQCESEDASFFREYRESVLDDKMVFVNNIIPMLM